MRRLIPFVNALALGLVFCAAATLADDHKAKDDHPAKDDGHHKPPAANSPLAPFRGLAGDWVGKMEGQDAAGEVTASYKVTSGGHAVVETIAPGKPMEMVTVIHEDGDRLVLTHYCAIGNQPRMKTAAKPGPHKFKFEFESATNLKSDKDMHMRNVEFELLDKDTLKATWTNYMAGEPAGTAVFVMKRKK